MKELLDKYDEKYRQTHFIDQDPIQIPKAFERKEDIEIAAFFSALFAWGQRKTIISKSLEIIDRMGGSPFDFINHSYEIQSKKLNGFKHRTFHDVDVIYYCRRLTSVYTTYQSIYSAFWPHEFDDIEKGLNRFYTFMFNDDEIPKSAKRHISCPKNKSACKRMNMFLRWMIRKDKKKIDLGLWKAPTSCLKIPLDVHVGRAARKYGLLKRKQDDWLAVLELTENLKKYNPNDPVKYDYALFGLGLELKNAINKP